jgi:hypothetical protein
VASDAAGIVLMGGELNWPKEEVGQDLGPEDWTRELYSNLVTQANMLLLELRARTHPTHTPSDDGGPGLAYVYTGQGLPLAPEHLTSEVEPISGAFRLVCWLPVTGAIIGNGESPEKLWAVPENPERA